MARSEYYNYALYNIFDYNSKDECNIRHKFSINFRDINRVTVICTKRNYIYAYVYVYIIESKLNRCEMTRQKLPQAIYSPLNFTGSSLLISSSSKDC